MLARILDWSLHHRALVIAAWAGIAGLGVVSAIELPLDAFPDTTPVQVQINTVAESLSPLEIERQITAPIEAATSGVPGLEEIRSISKLGFSQVTATFVDGTDIHLARQLLGERLRTVSLPEELDPPTLGPLATGLGEVFHYLVTGDVPLSELRSAHEWLVRPQMLAVRGVAEVNTWGGDERQIHVEVEPLALQRYGLSLAELAEGIETNASNVGGGTLEQGGESTLVHGIAMPRSIADVEEMVIAAREGVPIRVRDVARVVEGRQIRRGAVTADGRGEVVLGLSFTLIGENSHDVTTRLRARLAEVTRSLPAGIRVEPVYDRTTLVDRVLGTVRTNLLEGAALVVLVLFVFLRDLRAGFLVAAVIPLSMLFATNLMLVFGVAGSLMSLGAIDFGLLVDSAVIQVENVAHRLGASGSEGGSEGEGGGESHLERVRRAIQEVRGPTVFGEMIIAIVYLPILALEGIEGRLFRPMALTLLFALAGSLALSLTLVPALASLVLRPSLASPRMARAGERIRDAYARLLRAGLGRPATVLGVATAAAIGSFALFPTLGSELVPRLGEGAIAINTIRLAGVSLDESVRYGTRIERLLLASFPDEIERVWSRTGTGEVATDPMGLELTDVFVTLTPREQWSRAATQAELVVAMSAALDGLPGMRSAFTQPIEMRVNEMVAGVRADVGVIVYGDDFDVLRAEAREIEGVLRRIDGGADVVTEALTGQPVLRIEVDRQAIARHGVAARDVLAVVRALGPVEVAAMQDGLRRIPIALRLDDAYRISPETVGRVLVSAPNGDRIPLSRLARITVEESPSTISRTWGRRRVVVQVNVRGRDVGSFVDEARAALESRGPMPEGTYYRFGGQFENLARAERRLAIVVPLALALVLFLLFSTYHRAADALRVFVGVPFAAIGGVLALAVRGLPFSVSAGVGFVALAGVAVLGDMVLVSGIRARLDEGEELGEAIVHAATRRLRPVVMTALVASLGFVPMALNTGFGAEVQRPLATVVVGGVLSSTLLTLVVLPVLFAVSAGRGAKRDVA
jgi:cobalt-zinc-cadmium resistance protein CzcA